MNSSHSPHWPVSRSILVRTLILPMLAGLGWLAVLPEASQAATATGGTTTTMSLKYYATGSKWVMRCDPEDVESFQLHIQFDPGEAVPDLTFSPEMGVDGRNPFMMISVVPDGANGYQVSGTALSLTPGDVDIFEGRFTATPPIPPSPAPAPAGGGLGAVGTGNNKPLDQIKFTMFAKGNDFIMARDPNVPGSVSRRITAAEIGTTSRTVTPGVNPMVWDPDAVNDNGTMGGPGTWNTTGVSWDNLNTNVLGPVQEFPNVFWGNSINVNDEAIFGGNPGTGIVTLAEPISAGGLRFDMPGYTFQGGSLNLSKPGGAAGTIDTGGNDATINSPIVGSSGLQKIGKGTLTLGGANTYTGATTIKGGTVALDATNVFPGGQNQLSDNSAILFTGKGTLRYLNGSTDLRAENVGALTFGSGDGTVEIVSGGFGATFLVFNSLVVPSGVATGNFVVANALSTGIFFVVSPPTAQLLSPTLFFNGADYAAVNPGAGAFERFVRALNYGSDANTSPIDTAAPNTHVKITGPAPGTLPGFSFRTLNLGGNAAGGTFGADQTLTLSEGGLIKSGGGAPGMISHAPGNLTGGLTTAGPTLVVRTDTVADALTIASPIFNTAGLLKSGAGTLTLTGTNTFTGPTDVLEGTLIVNGSIATSSAVNLSGSATLGGTGTVGALSGAGTVSPGASAGILTATSVDPSLDMGFHFEVSQFGPDYLFASASGNDVLHLTGATPFTTGLCATNRLLFDLGVPFLTLGDLFIVGFFTDSLTDFSDYVRDAAYVSTFNGTPMPGDFGIVFDQMIPQIADFGAGPVAGRALQIRIVPEPGTLSLLLLGTLGLLRRVRQRF